MHLLINSRTSLRCHSTVPAAASRSAGRVLICRATLEAGSPETKSNSSTPSVTPPADLSARVNSIPRSAWDDGIPPVMGGHLMASGTVSQISTSKALGRSPEAFMFYYPAPAEETTVRLFPDATAVSEGLADLLAVASMQAVAQRGAFSIAVSGGSLLDSLSALSGRADIAFDKWHVFFADERNVPLDSPDSNYAAASAKFIGRVGVPASQVHTPIEWQPYVETDRDSLSPVFF